jgi:hypothetical protein
MSASQEKVAGMLDTSEAALEITHSESTPDKKIAATLIAQFANMQMSATAKTWPNCKPSQSKWG